MKCVLVVLSLAALAVAPAAQQPTPVDTAKSAATSPQDPDMRAFLDAVAQYMQLHRRLHNELPGLTPQSDAKTITQTSDALARAIQRARPKARQGDFFSKAPSVAIKERLAKSDLVVLVGIDDEPPSIRTPRVHMRFPEGNQMATMPPSILQSLPPLPPELEYRIVGQYLVLRDTHAALILDFLPQAIPNRK